MTPPPVLDELVSHWLHTYTHMIRVPIVDPPMFDGTRDTSREFQEAIDRTVDSLIERFRVPVHRLNPAERGEWIEHVGAVIGVIPTPPQMGLFAAE